MTKRIISAPHSSATGLIVSPANQADSPTSCALCGDSSESAVNAMIEYSLHVPDIDLCWSCADRAANAFWKKHSGEWLTWENQKNEVPINKKAVISRSMRTEVFERDMYRCLRCGDHKRLRADHVIPESQGGETTVDNLQTLCLPCNSWKGVQTIDYRGGANE